MYVLFLQQFKGSSSVQKTSIPSNIGDIKSVAKKALPEPMRRESREWKPSAQFFKPLLAGWKREVIFENRDPDTRELLGKPEQIVYHAPPNPGCKARSFKSLAELGSFLSSASSALTLHNFSFRKELMNAPRNQEIAHAIDEEAVIFPKHQSSTVSQPPPPKIGSNKESLSKPKLPSNPTISDQPGVKPFSHAPKSWNSNQQYVSPNTSSKLIIYPTNMEVFKSFETMVIISILTSIFLILQILCCLDGVVALVSLNQKFLAKLWDKKET